MLFAESRWIFVVSCVFWCFTVVYWRYVGANVLISLASFFISENITELYKFILEISYVVFGYFTSSSSLRCYHCTVCS